MTHPKPPKTRRASDSSSSDDSVILYVIPQRRDTNVRPSPIVIRRQGSRTLNVSSTPYESLPTSTSPLRPTIPADTALHLKPCKLLLLVLFEEVQDIFGRLPSALINTRGVFNDIIFLGSYTVQFLCVQNRILSVILRVITTTTITRTNCITYKLIVKDCIC